MRVLIPSLVLLAACADHTLTPPVQGGVDSEPERGLTVVGIAPEVELEAPAPNDDIELDALASDEAVEEWEDVPGIPVAIAIVVDVGYRSQADADLLRRVALSAIEAAGRAPHPQDSLSLVAHTDRMASRLTPALGLAVDGPYDALVQVASGIQSCSSLRDPDGWSDVGYDSFAPQMPPCWGDERGTDLAAALALAGEALDDAPDDAVRGIIIVGPGGVRPLAAPANRPESVQLPWPSLVLHPGEASHAELESAALDQAAALADDGIAVWSIATGSASDAQLAHRLTASGGAVHTRSGALIEQTVRDAVRGLHSATGR